MRVVCDLKVGRREVQVAGPEQICRPALSGACVCLVCTGGYVRHCEEKGLLRRRQVSGVRSLESRKAVKVKAVEAVKEGRMTGCLDGSPLGNFQDATRSHGEPLATPMTVAASSSGDLQM